jgi:hypothetical protein
MFEQFSGFDQVDLIWMTPWKLMRWTSWRQTKNRNKSEYMCTELHRIFWGDIPLLRKRNTPSSHSLSSASKEQKISRPVKICCFCALSWLCSHQKIPLDTYWLHSSPIAEIFLLSFLRFVINGARYRATWQVFFFMFTELITWCLLCSRPPSLNGKKDVRASMLTVPLFQ